MWLRYSWSLRSLCAAPSPERQGLPWPGGEGKELRRVPCHVRVQGQAHKVSVCTCTSGGGAADIHLCGWGVCVQTRRSIGARAHLFDSVCVSMCISACIRCVSRILDCWRCRRLREERCSNVAAH